jgi:hypothetical protein
MGSVTVFVDPTIGVAYQEAQENAFLASASGLTMINFDEWPNGTILSGNEYAGLGILFSQPGGYQLRAYGDPQNGTPRSLPNCLVPFGGSGIDERLQLDLPTPRYAVGLWLIDSEFTQPGFNETVDFYNAAYQLVASIPMPRTDYQTNGPDGNFFVAAISSDPIARVIMNEAPNEPIIEDVGWDNVYFGAPEPGSLSLLGLAAVTLLRRAR